MSPRELERRAKHKLAVLRHVEEVSGSAEVGFERAAPSADQNRSGGDREDPLAPTAVPLSGRKESRCTSPATTT